MSSLVVRGERVVLPHGIRASSIEIVDGRIARVGEHGERPAGVEVIDAGELVVMPGIVDSHVHINDPGRADWEGFEHATRAAAAGGVTTLVDMPLNSIPPTTTVEGLEAKLRSADGRCHVDVAFWGGVVPGNSASLEPLARRGVRGFKCFLAPSGVEEFPHIGEADLREALPILSRLRLPLLAHAEDPARLVAPASGADPRSHQTWLESRPIESEHAAIEMLIRLAVEFSTHVHVVHLASADALPMIDAARAAGAPLTAETCPHYLTFAAEEIPHGATAFKCAPPIRQRDHRERLWRALETGELELVATDHSPAPPSIKCLEEGDFLRAWGGVASLQLGLAIVSTGAAKRSHPVERLAHWMTKAPARLAGLDAKGAIAPGRDADLVIWDPDAEWIVDPATLHHRHAVTPYAGMPLRGRVRRTLLRGTVVFDGERVTSPPRGRLLLTPRC